MKIEKTPNAEGKVDVRLKFEEQNRNQLSFGAGISQFEGFFGQAGLPDVEFHGPRRDAVDFGAEGIAGAQLPAGVHRAVPVRPADHGASTCIHGR